MDGAAATVSVPLCAVQAGAAYARTGRDVRDVRVPGQAVDNDATVLHGHSIDAVAKNTGAGRLHAAGTCRRNCTGTERHEGGDQTLHGNGSRQQQALGGTGVYLRGLGLGGQRGSRR